MRVRSTQKLPIRSVRGAGEPADERHRDGDADGRGEEVLHGEARPSARCSRGPASPEYDCQFVFVTKLTAVFSAWSDGIPSRPRE